MNEIKRQVGRAQRRLVLEQFAQSPAGRCLRLWWSQRSVWPCRESGSLRLIRRHGTGAGLVVASASVC